MLMQFSELAFRLLELPTQEHERGTHCDVKIDVDLIRLAEIFAYIWSPKDERRRASLTMEAWAMVAQHSDNLDFVPIKDTICTSCGTLNAFRSVIRIQALRRLVFGPSLSAMEKHKAMESADLAAQILWTVRAISMAGSGGSLNKAIFVLDRVRVAGRTRLFQAWGSHKSVAHLKWALNVEAEMHENEPGPKALWTMSNAILGIAREMQTFAISDKHISSSELWEVPPDVGSDFELNLKANYFPLTDDAAAALKEYRAPK